MNDRLMQQLQEISERRATIDAQVKSLRKEAIAEVQTLIDQFGLKASCFRFPKDAGILGANHRAAPQKYRDPATGKTWSGRGRSPAWMQVALESGKSKDDFLIRD